MWQNYIPKVIIPNLKYRKDREERMIALLHEYGIEATIWEAREHERGAIGLMLTMKDIFNWCLKEGLERALVLEDDCEMLVTPESFHSILDKCVDDLKGFDWGVFYLGVQHPMGFKKWMTPNILPVRMGFSTHAVLYSKKAMEFFVSSVIDEPIDNFLVREYQKHNTSFCSYPMLCSQIEGHSDIGGQWTSWKRFLEGSFDNWVRDILPKRFK